VCLSALHIQGKCIPIQAVEALRVVRGFRHSAHSLLVLSSVRGLVDPRAIVQLEELGKLKNPPHPTLEPSTFQLAD
jgi:hypothetical protein